MAKDYEFDVFLGGPRQKHYNFYADWIIDSLPELRFFHWESRKAQQQANFHSDNIWGLENSWVLLGYCPSFSMPELGEEIGMFYHMHGGVGEGPLDEIVLIWPAGMNKEYGRHALQRYGKVVDTVDESILYLKDYFGIS